MAKRVKLKSAGMAALLKSDEVRALLQAPAQRVLAAAQADPHDDTGAYEAGLYIEQATTDRAVTRVVSGDRKGHILEANYGILARALDAGDAARLLKYTTKSGKKRMATQAQIDNWTRGQR